MNIKDTPGFPCKECPLYKAEGPVWGEEHDSKPQLVLIGQSPNSEEYYRGGPFVGRGGQLVNHALAKAGIKRENTYSTFAVKCRTPNSRAPTWKEADICSKFLTKELTVQKERGANTALVFGNTAWNGIPSLRRSSLRKDYKPTPLISKRQGCVELHEGFHFIASTHPGYVLNNPEQTHYFYRWFRKAKELINKPAQPVKIEIYPSDERVKEGVQRAQQFGAFADDVETVKIEGFTDEKEYFGHDDWHCTMAGFSPEYFNALVCKPKQIHLWKPMLSHPNIRRFEHNAPFDTYYVDKYSNQTRGAIHIDTMLAAHYVHSSLPKELKPHTLSMYTSLPYFDRTLAKVDEAFYNGMDCITTLHAGINLLQELTNAGSYDLFMEMGMPALWELEDMRKIGVNCDLRRAMIIRAVIEQRKAKAEELWDKVAPFVNWASPKQLKEFLYDGLKLPEQRKQVYSKGNYESRATTDYEARKRLQEWIKQQPDPEVFKRASTCLSLLDFISGEKKKLEYVDRIEPDGRMHVYFKAHGTASLRLASTPNLQNFPVYSVLDWGGARKEQDAENPSEVTTSGHDPGSLRSFIVPDRPDEQSLLTADFSQAQLAIFAFRFDVKWIKEIYAKGEYLYGPIYEELYKEPFFKEGMPRTKANKLKVPEQRMRRTKAVPLGFLFGRSHRAVAEEYGWSIPEAKELQDWWYDLNPELKQAYDKIATEINRTRKIKHPHGNVMFFPEPEKARTLRQAINSCAQSPEAVIMTQTLVKVGQELRKRGYHPHRARILLSVHDSLTLSVDHELIEEVYEEIMEPTMTRPIPELDNLRLGIEADVSDFWDWQVTPYEVWKKQYAESRRASQVNSQNNIREET